MFLCEPCHTAAFGEGGGHLSQSRGPCEACGKTAVCADCHCRVVPNPPPSLATASTTTPPSQNPPAPPPDLPEAARKGIFIHPRGLLIRVHRRTIAQNGYPPHHSVWKALAGEQSAILQAYAAVTGDTTIWIIPGEGGYRFYILRDHAEEFKTNKEGEFIP